MSVARLQRNLSQRELAAKTGLTQVAISHIETGRTKPRRSTQQLLAYALEYRVVDIWPDEEAGEAAHRDLRAARRRQIDELLREDP